MSVRTPRNLIIVTVACAGLTIAKTDPPADTARSRAIRQASCVRRAPAAPFDWADECEDLA